MDVTIMMYFLTPSLPQLVKFLGWKMHTQYISRSHNTSTFSAICFNENLFTCQCKKEDIKAQGFQILQFFWSFSNVIMAVKGLKLKLTNVYMLHVCCVCYCSHGVGSGSCRKAWKVWWGKHTTRSPRENTRKPLGCVLNLFAEVCNCMLFADLWSCDCNVDICYIFF